MAEHALDYVDVGSLGIDSEEEFEALCRECGLEMEPLQKQVPKTMTAGDKE